MECFCLPKHPQDGYGESRENNAVQEYRSKQVVTLLKVSIGPLTTYVYSMWKHYKECSPNILLSLLIYMTCVVVSELQSTICDSMCDDCLYVCFKKYFFLKYTGEQSYLMSDISHYSILEYVYHLNSKMSVHVYELWIQYSRIKVMSAINE